jgi:LysM repeat protein
VTALSTRVVVVALVSGVALAGCGLGGGTSSTTTTTKKTTTLPTQQVTVPPLTSTATTVVPAVASTNQPGPSATSSTQSYTVQAGDAWFAIAQKLGVDLQSLLDANGMTLTTALFPGMRLVVPPKSSPSLPPAQPSSSGTTTTTKTTVAVGGSYTVVPNDSWGVIASKVGVKLADLLSVNGATQATVIHPGQVLKVPKGATATSTTTKAAASTTTTVKKA